MLLGLLGAGALTAVFFLRDLYAFSVTSLVKSDAANRRTPKRR